MNRFMIAKTPQEIAEQQCDKHAVKMPLEEAQMLSTVHRMLDGKQVMKPSKSGKRMVKYWELPDEREVVLYKPVHMNHPCTQWAAETTGNYLFAKDLFFAMCEEYTYRYGKTHLSYEKLGKYIITPPKNINPDLTVTSPPLAMGAAPHCINHNDVIGSYRNYYKTKTFKMVWTNRPTPEWWKAA